MGENPAGTRELLLGAAIEMLAAGGEASVRVDAVADAAGVKRPSVYHYFGDREGLIVAAQAERYRQTLLFGMGKQTAILRACRTRDEYLTLLRAWMSTIAERPGVERRLVRIEVLGASATRPRLRALVAAIDAEAAQHIAAVLAVAQDRKWTSSRFDLTVAAMWWIGMMNGRYLVEGPTSSDHGAEWNEIATEAVIRLFGAPPDVD